MIFFGEEAFRSRSRRSPFVVFRTGQPGTQSVGAGGSQLDQAPGVRAKRADLVAEQTSDSGVEAGLEASSIAWAGDDGRRGQF